MESLGLKASVGALIIVFVVGAIFLTQHHKRTLRPYEAPFTAAAIHSESWFVSHQNILNEVEQSCGNNVASIPEADCENARNAQNVLYIRSLGAAAAANK